MLCKEIHYVHKIRVINYIVHERFHKAISELLVDSDPAQFMIIDNIFATSFKHKINYTKLKKLITPEQFDHIRQRISDIVWKGDMTHPGKNKLITFRTNRVTQRRKAKHTRK